MNCQIDTLRVASGAFLCDFLPDTWEYLSQAEKDEFLESNAWQPLETWPAKDIWEVIEDHAKALTEMLESNNGDEDV